MTYYEQCFLKLLEELKSCKGISILIESNDTYIARSLSFSYKKVKKNKEIIEKLANIIEANELTIRVLFTGNAKNFAFSDRRWYNYTCLLLEGFIPDKTIKISGKY